MSALGITATARGADGTLDGWHPTYTFGEATSFVYDVVRATDGSGKMYVSGQFTDFNGTGRSYLVRLHANGTLDTDFSLPTLTGSSLSVNNVLPVTDGSLFVSGNWTHIGGVNQPRCAKLTSTGSLDSTFNANMFPSTFRSVDDDLTDLVELSGGGFLLTTESWGWGTIDDALPTHGVVKLSSTGVRDMTYDTNLGTGFTTSSVTHKIVPLSSGKYLVSGNFYKYKGVTTGPLVRLNSDGYTRDTSFKVWTGASDYPAHDLALDSQGRIYVAGWFSTWDGTSRTGLVRLDADGNLDTTWMTATGSGPNSSVEEIFVDASDRLIGVGYLTSFNGTTVPRIFRLSSSGTLDTDFTDRITLTYSGGNPLPWRGLLDSGFMGRRGLYAAGRFSTANGLDRHKITRFNI